MTGSASADPELRSAVEAFADELETLTIGVAEAPDDGYPVPRTGRSGVPPSAPRVVHC